MTAHNTECVVFHSGPKSRLQNRLLFHLSHKFNDEKRLMGYHQNLQDIIEDQLSLASIHYLRSHYQESIDIYKRILLDNRCVGVALQIDMNNDLLCTWKHLKEMCWNIGLWPTVYLYLLFLVYGQDPNGQTPQRRRMTYINSLLGKIWNITNTAEKIYNMQIHEHLEYHTSVFVAHV